MVSVSLALMRGAGNVPQVMIIVRTAIKDLEYHLEAVFSVKMQIVSDVTQIISNVLHAWIHTVQTKTSIAFHAQTQTASNVLKMLQFAHNVPIHSESSIKLVYNV